MERFADLAKTSPEKAGKIIVRGIKRNKRRIIVGLDAWGLDKLIRLFPVRYTPFIVRFFFNKAE